MQLIVRSLSQDAEEGITRRRSSINSTSTSSAGGYAHHQLVRFTSDELQFLKKLSRSVGGKTSTDYDEGIDTTKRVNFGAEDCSDEELSYGLEDDEMNDDHKLTSLSQDTFAFLIMSPIRSILFLTGSIVTFIKILIYSLVFANLIKGGSPGNILGVPSTQEWPTVVFQFFAVAITVISQVSSFLREFDQNFVKHGSLTGVPG